jgi:hypothetical protein
MQVTIFFKKRFQERGLSFRHQKTHLYVLHFRWYPGAPRKKYKKKLFDTPFPLWHLKKSGRYT